MLHICLHGKHSNRTPLAYEPYRRLVQGRVRFETTPEGANVILLGFKKDLVDNANTIQRARRHNRSLRVVIISEEPLWDSVWSGDFLSREQVYGIGSDVIPFRYLNHANSNIFQFEKIPYFPTTDTDFAVRYASLFTRNAALKAEDILEIWKAARIRRAYYLEKRTTETYGVRNTAAGVVGLSLLRSRIAEMDSAPGIVRVGRGWDNGTRRQDRPDWHLEKLAALDCSALIVSAIENTHVPYYITEKIFDAFAVLSIPIYHAGPNHAVNRIVDKGTYIDVFGLTAQEALAKICRFEPSLEFAARYLDAQRKLAHLFCDTTSYQRERWRVANSILGELAAIAEDRTCRQNSRQLRAPISLAKILLKRMYLKRGAYSRQT
jgi:hypothetical protein